MSRLVKVIREAFYHGFQPIFTAAVFAIWWLLPGRDQAPLETAIAVLLVANVAVYWLEHVKPDRHDWLTSSTDRKIDAFYVALRVIVLGPVFQVVVLLALEPLLRAVGSPTLWPTDLPVLARIGLTLVIAELIAFVMHIAMHCVPLLWRFHATHHVQTKLTSARWSSGHPGEFALFQLPIIVVITVLGPDLVDIAGAVVLGRTTTIVAHSNLRLTPKGIGWFVTTPEQHRRHHARETMGAANFGDVFIMFDRLVRTFCPEQAREVGLASGPELTLREQLTLPLRLDLVTEETIIDLREPQRPKTRSNPPSTAHSAS